MGIRQTTSGNPEVKYIWLTDNFVGGTNIMYSDDTVEDGEFRQLLNYNLDSRGALDKRKGYTLNAALSELLFSDNAPELPVFKQGKVSNNTIKNILLFKFLENTNNVWTLLSNAKSISDVQETMNEDEQYELKILLLIQLNDGSNKYYVNQYIIKPLSVDRKQLATGSVDADMLGDKVLTDISYGEDTSKLYFTNNKQGLIMFNKSDNTFSYSNPKNGGKNSVYKPSALEIRKVGFNVLGDEPLSWIGSSTITTKSIQGVYLTTTDRIPVQIIPSSYKFQINIIYTGTIDSFDIKLIDTTKTENNEISIEKVKNETYSKDGLLVYDIAIKVQPTDDIELNVSVTGDATISTYRDYFSIGEPSPQAKPVEKLNVGEMQTIEISQRLVYYKGDTIWFSEINVYDYIPNYNYVILPIDGTDEIVKIAFFRTCHIVFTRNRIYKLTGTFGNDDFTVSLVSGSIGCTAPNSVCVVNNKLVFLSQVGLKHLKFDTFRENLENLESLDDKVYPFFITNEHAYGFVYKNQYVLLHNFRGENPDVQIRYSNFKVPDTCRYYYEMEAFVFDEYATDTDSGEKIFPYHLIVINGELYTTLQLSDGKSYVFKYGGTESDFGYVFSSVFQTAGVNTQYPLHKKKFKNVILKTIGGELAQPLFIKVFADGTLYYDTLVGVTSINPNGEVIYEMQNKPTTTLPPSIAKLDSPIPPVSTVVNPDGSITSTTGLTKDQSSTIILGTTRLGETPIIVRKIKLPVSCKNIAIEVTTTTGSQLNVLAVGYTFKLGKVKE